MRAIATFLVVVPLLCAAATAAAAEPQPAVPPPPPPPSSDTRAVEARAVETPLGQAGSGQGASAGDTSATKAGAPDPERSGYGRTQLGGAGLSRVRSALVSPGTLSVSAQGGYFQQQDFGAVGGSAENRLALFGASLAPIPYLEISAASRSDTLSNPASPVPNAYLVNDLWVRAKGAFKPGKPVGLGLDVALRVPPPAFSDGVKGLSPYLGGLLTLDLRAWDVPLLFHLNTGIYFDNSVDFDDAQRSVTRGYALQITTYNQWQGAAALEGRFSVGDVWIVPFVEYTVDVPLGADAYPQRLVPGVRVLPWRGLFVDAAVEVGLRKPHVDGVAQVPDWQVLFSLGYQASLSPGRETVVERIVEKEKAVDCPKPAATSASGSAAPAKGKVRGMVKDADSGKPIADAVIRLAGGGPRLLTDAEGQFEFASVEPGPVVILASLAGFADAEAKGAVGPGRTFMGQLALKALPPPPPKPMTVRGTIIDEKGGPLAATVAVPGSPEVKPVVADKGEFELAAPAGELTVEVSAPGYLKQGRRLIAKAGDSVISDFVLKPTPKQILVVVRKEKIEIKKQIFFATAKDVILPDSAPLLDQIASTILDNPQIHAIRIEGHSDNQGDDATNLSLSKRRAASVLRALVERGVAPSRLKAEGYGKNKPIASNNTAAGRGLNRRVEFMIEKDE